MYLLATWPSLPTSSEVVWTPLGVTQIGADFLSLEPCFPLHSELFSAPFPLQSLSSPSELSAIFHIILAGIKYNCVWKVQKSKLPWGIVPVSPVELKTGVSLKRYVFQAAGVLICKAHYSNKTLKQPSMSQPSRPVSTPAPSSPSVGFLSSFRAQSQDLSIDILTLAFTHSLCHCIASWATALWLCAVFLSLSLKLMQEKMGSSRHFLGLQSKKCYVSGMLLTYLQVENLTDKCLIQRYCIMSNIVDNVANTFYTDFFKKLEMSSLDMP